MEMEFNRTANLNPYKKPKVLVMDDNIDAVKLISMILKHHFCDISVALDGQDAVSMLMDEDYDLIVVDLSMPNMNGDEALMMVDQIFGADKSRQPTPVIIYSGHEQEDIDLPVLRNFRYLGVFNKRHHYRNLMMSFEHLLGDRCIA